MKAVDRWLQTWRILKARSYIKKGSRVLDVGCADGALFKQLGTLIDEGVGLDPDLEAPIEVEGYRLLPGTFPNDLEGEGPFDVITMLAVLEHIEPQHQREMARGCSQYLKPGGYLVVTTPAPMVDHILDALAALRIIDGMSLEQHYGFDPKDTPKIFVDHGLELIKAEKFQLGLNHLFLFRKTAAPKASLG